MIPKAIAWQHLRSLSLDAVPEHTRVYHTKAIPLHEWRTRGAFNVVSCTKAAIVLETAGAEIGSALLSDTEFLLDHAAEHNALMRTLLARDQWHSPAWTLVTAYYWAFFSCLALTRVTGHSVLFLDRQAITNLRTLAGSERQPGAGALFLDLQGYTSGTVRTVTLKPSKAQLHDAAWTAAQRLIMDVLMHADKDGNALEYRFWSLLARPGTLFGADWCSNLRNLVNYRPGCAYREVTRQAEIDLARYTSRLAPATLPELVDSLELALEAIPVRATPSDSIKLFSRLLLLFAMVVSAVVAAVHVDVLDRHAGDERWRNLRLRFLREQCLTADNKVWPFRA